MRRARAICSNGVVFALLMLAACSPSTNKVARPDNETGTRAAFIRDCTDCPDMVAIPAGTFIMGSPATEQYRGAELQHTVTIRAPFAVSKFEITFDEWDTCAKDGGCGRYVPDDQGWGRGKRPVINVSWDNARAYVEWLSKRTGKSYRLLSEAEWEYAARAGTKTAYSFGDEITTAQANYDASGGAAVIPELNRQRTVPVGSFPANTFGLHDMHGNVWEWVEDCWHDEYGGAPVDGSAWVTPSCKGHVLRGGSWEDYAGDLRSAARTGGNTEDQYYSDGFRVARAL